MSASDVTRISDEDLIEGLVVFRENLKFLLEESIIVSMAEFVKVKKTVRILEKELSRRNKERLTTTRSGRFIVYSRKSDG